MIGFPFMIVSSTNGDSDEATMLYEDDELEQPECDFIRDPLSGWPHEIREKLLTEGMSWWGRCKFQITRKLRRVLL